MNILIVAATRLEIEPLFRRISGLVMKSELLYVGIYKNHHISLLITGIGMVKTTYELTSIIGINHFDLFINAGIAGSYITNLDLGKTVLVGSEQFADLGIEDQNGLHTLQEKGIEESKAPFVENRLVAPNVYDEILIKKMNLKRVNAITVNKIPGTERSILELARKFQPEIETMEGAAFFYVCKMRKKNFIQLRAISNYVEPRNKDAWNIPLAVENLTKTILFFFDCIA